MLRPAARPVLLSILLALPARASQAPPVLGRPALLGPDELGGLPLQLIALPWVSRSGLMAALDLSGEEPAKVYEEMEARLSGLIRAWLEQLNPDLPAVLTAHASVHGALMQSKRPRLRRVFVLARAKRSR